MSKIRQLIKERLWPLSGLLVLSLLIWWLGDGFSFKGRALLEPPLKRAAFILLVWAFYFGALLARALYRRRIDHRVARQLAGEEGESLVAEDQRQIQAAFSSALRALQQDYETRHGRWRLDGGVYQLPWYVIIGPPGTGKTTTLVNSNLHFLLSDKNGRQALKGVGGTRLCDWWFTDEAVLIDTAGRFTSQNVDGDRDKAGWMSFLGQLKKYRPAQPLNGVLVVLSVMELLDETGLIRTLESLRLRLQELQSKLDHQLPVYLIINKMDMLEGFTDFFASMDQEERNKAWGFTAQLQSSGELTLTESFVVQQLEGIYERLSQYRLTRMEQEANLLSKTNIMLFPEQFRFLIKSVQRVASSILHPASGLQPVLFRGVYLTSATQHGTAIDKVLDSIGMNAPAPTAMARGLPTGKSFFINDVLRKVVIPEAGLVSTGPALKARRRRTIIVACMVPVLVFLLMMAVWLVSYAQSKHALEALQSQQRAIEAGKPSGGSDLLTQSDYLAQLRGLADDAYARQAALPLSGLGLSALSEYGDQALYLYNTSLRAAFARTLFTWLERELRQVGDNRYQLLKTYLAFGDRHEVNEQSLAVLLVDQVIAKKVGQLESSQRAALVSHVHNLMLARPLMATEQLDAGLIEQVRVSLRGGGVADVAYSVLQERMGGKVKDFLSADAVGSGGAMVFGLISGKSFSATIPGLYTRESYQRILDDELDEALEALAADREWVLGESKESMSASIAHDDLRRMVLERYLRDYAQVWDRFVRSIKLSESAAIGDLLQKTKLLTEPDNLLPRLLESIARETSLTRTPGKQGTVKGALDAVGALTRDERTDSLARGIVDNQFGELFGLLYVPEKKADYDALLALIRKIAERAVMLDEAGRMPGAVPPATDLLAEIRLATMKYPAPVSGILNSYYVFLDKLSRGALTQGLSNELSGGVTSSCQKLTANKYPLVRAAKEDISFADFGRLFSQTGMIAVFFDKNLRSMVDTGSETWRRAGGETGLVISPESIAAFQLADKIRAGFFQNGSSLPFFSFEIKWVEVPPALLMQQLRIEVDGQAQTVEPGAVQNFNWPALPGGNYVRFSVGGELYGRLNFSGPWSVFRLIDAGAPAYLNGGRTVKLKWALPEGALLAEIRANSVTHPFIPAALDSFRCPSKL